MSDLTYDTRCAARSLCEHDTHHIPAHTEAVRVPDHGGWMHPDCYDTHHPAAHAWANRKERERD